MFGDRRDTVSPKKKIPIWKWTVLSESYGMYVLRHISNMNFQSCAIVWAVGAFFSNIFCPVRHYFCQELFEIYSRCQLKNGAHLLNLMHRYTSPWMIKFRVSSQGDLQTSNDQIKINVLPSTRLLWDFFFRLILWYQRK